MSMKRVTRAVRSSAGCLAIAAMAWGCEPQAVVGPSLPEDLAPLLLQANVSATSVTALVVVVTGPDIATPLVFNIEVSNGVATGAIVVPTGSDRTITVHAYDANGIETHRGSVTLDVHPGTNPTVSVTLLPLAGQQPIDAQLGSLVVVVEPGAVSLTVGETAQLSTTILDANGDPMEGEVRWATMNPAVAAVSQNGMVTAMKAGETMVVATFNGVGGSSTITVTGG